MARRFLAAGRGTRVTTLPRNTDKPVMGFVRWRVALFVLIVALALCWWLVAALRGELPLGVAVAGTMLFFSQRLLMEPPRNPHGATGTRAGQLSAIASGMLPRWYLELRLLEECRRHGRDGQPMVIACFRGAAASKAGALLPHVALGGLLDGQTLAACLTRCGRQQSIPALRRIMAELGDEGWQVGISILPDDGSDPEVLLELAQRRLMPWRVSSGRPPAAAA
jgi:hypothetical protein